MRLYLIRHGLPQVASGICYGSTDVTVAVEEVVRVATSVVAQLPRGASLYTSPLRRCQQLAACLAATLHVIPIPDERLGEMHFGAWEMRAWNDISRAEIDAWTDKLIHYRFPGGGESVLDAAQRVHSFYQSLRARPVQHAVVVCHAGTIRLLNECVKGGGVEQIAERAACTPHRIAYGALLCLDC